MRQLGPKHPIGSHMSSGITPLTFTGVSTYSSDLQTILTRAVSIASLPVKQMQNDQSTILGKKQALGGLSSSVAALADAVTKLGTVGDTSALSVSSSNANRVSVSNNGLTAAASYSITEITSIAKAASETTAAGVATADTTPVDADGHLELVFGGQTHAIDISSSNNLNTLAQKINDLGLGLTATVLNTGAVGNPYYLSLTSATTGKTTLQLNDTAGSAASNLLTSANQGANAEFKLNGLAVSKPDNVISDVIPNLTFTIADKTAANETVVLTAASSRGSLATALQTFVDAYNGVASARNAQIGTQAGILSGDSVIHQIGRSLSTLTGFTTRTAGTGLVQSLADIGIELDKTGKMTFNAIKFYSLPSANIVDGYSFFKSGAGGFGALASSLDAISNPLTGMIRTQQDFYDSADQRITSQINTLSDRINNMQLSLQSKLQQADALLSGLQIQQALIKASYDSVNLALFGKQNG
jgi:flagellar hook-associated protein 2